MAYLIGVPKKIFENENEPPKLEIYYRLELEKKARIIRNLCSLRTQLERSFLKICQGIQREGRSIIGMSEYIYSNDVDPFVLVSSDSDYWGLMEALPEANFLVMVEHEKCSYALKEELIQHGIFYCCYIDDFQS